MQDDVYTRAWFEHSLCHLLTGWRQALDATSASRVVWEPKSGLKYDYFLSASGLQVDGVTRMLPALAAWTAQPHNRPTLTLLDGYEFDPKAWIYQVFTTAMDPAQPDFWGYAPEDRSNQRQVESSIVAWALWLARDWLLPELTPTHIGHIQQWLASCTAFTDHYNNWTLFTALNHAVRLALRDYGFSGSERALQRDLLFGDEVQLGDGWLWDRKYSGIDYYNFWVFSSHHCYLQAMLPQPPDSPLGRALDRMEQRLADLPYFMDAQGRNVLVGRSLSYRWGWLNGLVAAHAIGRSPVAPGLARTMLGKNIQAWLQDGALDEHGLLRERLGPLGSDGGRSAYINCGHPYWGMQSFLCFAFPPDDPFWSYPAQPLPAAQGDFYQARQGPGFVLQGSAAHREVRCYNLRNLDHGGDALYTKFVYSTQFPCNSVSARRHATLWDTQLGIQLPDGAQIVAARVLELDVVTGADLHLIWQFDHAQFQATVHTTLEIEPDGYRSTHRITLAGTPPAGACWVEGGFTLPLAPGQTVQTHLTPGAGVAQRDEAAASVATQLLAGWQSLVFYHSQETPPDLLAPVLAGEESAPNILAGHACHFLLAAPLEAGDVRLAAAHRATLARPSENGLTI